MENNEKAQELPHFGLLIASLRRESDGAIELSTRIQKLSSILMPFNEDLDPSTKLEEAPLQEGIVGLLWSEVIKLRSANLRLERTMYHLERIVGLE